MSVIDKVSTVRAALVRPERRDSGSLAEVRSFRLTPARTNEHPPTASRDITLEPGDRVVLTGDMSRSREELQARLLCHGYTPWPWVTRNVKFVVAADLSSESPKAQRARQLGIPIIDEARLSELLR